jgi:hypothetical protein
MKRTVLMVLCILALAAASTYGEAAIPLVGTKALIESPRDYDGKEILFEGEAIGDPMRRGDHAWINVLDSNAAMGVFLPADGLAAISAFGSDKRSGDMVRVRGLFHRACPDHGGDMDIHAYSVEVVSRGVETAHPIGRLRLILAPASLALAFFLFWLWKRREAAARSRKQAF